MWRVFVLLVLAGCSASASGGLPGSPSTRSDLDIIRIPRTLYVVADEPTVRDERVSSHEIGHILGLAHALGDPDRLMFSGTNGVILTEAGQQRARATALEILDGT